MGVYKNSLFNVEVRPGTVGIKKAILVLFLSKNLVVRSRRYRADQSPFDKSDSVVGLLSEAVPSLQT